MTEDIRYSLPGPHDHPDYPKKEPTIPDIIQEMYTLVETNLWNRAPDGTWICSICSPIGYRLRRGADPRNHEENRNPPTHKLNRIWKVLQLMRSRGIPIPTGPDCYRKTTKGPWCFICYGLIPENEDMAIHDARHANWEQIIMRPNRLEAPKPTTRQPTGYSHPRPRLVSEGERALWARIGEDDLPPERPTLDRLPPLTQEQIDDINRRYPPGGRPRDVQPPNVTSDPDPKG